MDPHHDDTNSNLFQKYQNIATFPDYLSNCMVAPHLWSSNPPSWLQSLIMDPHLDNTNSNLFQRMIKTTMTPDLRLRTWQAKQIIQHFTDSLINNVKHHRKYPNPVLDYCYCCKKESSGDLTEPLVSATAHECTSQLQGWKTTTS